MRNSYKELSDYELKFLVYHLVKGGRADRSFSLLTDLPYLEARVESNSFDELLNDFTITLSSLEHQPERRLLVLLEEAIRRESDFIRRNPDSLFQVLWNLGWWYDAPRTEDYFLKGSVPLIVES